MSAEQQNEDVASTPPEPGFEENLDKLESIVAQLEEGNLSLDKAMALYQEGIEAYKACHEALQKAEAKVTRLVETLEGELKEEPLEEAQQ